MTTLDERTTVDRATSDEVALARAVLDGLPVQGPLLRADARVPADPRAEECAELAVVLEDARDRVGRLLALLQERPAGPEAVLR